MKHKNKRYPAITVVQVAMYRHFQRVVSDSLMQKGYRCEHHYCMELQSSGYILITLTYSFRHLREDIQSAIRRIPEIQGCFLRKDRRRKDSLQLIFPNSFLEGTISRFHISITDFLTSP